MTAEEIAEARLNVKYWNQLYAEWKELDRNPLSGGWIVKVGKNTGAGRKRSQVEKTIDRKTALGARINAAADRWFAFEAELEEISKRSEEDDLVAAIMYYRGLGNTWEKVDRIIYGKGQHGTHVSAMQLRRWLEKEETKVSC